MLRALAECIRSARGNEIAVTFDYRGLKQLLDQVRGCSIKPLDPLLDKIAAKIDRFTNDDVHNGFIAVGWCIDHGLVPQGLTLLQETMISDRVAKRFGKEHLLDLEKRDIVAQALNIGSKGIPEADWKSPAREHQDDVRAVLQDLPPGFLEIFDGLSQARNDINHGGFSPVAAKPATLESRLREYHQRAISMIDDNRSEKGITV
nr:TM1812 family CRISPR-associated protein [Candidatus Sigynarchaeum springense]